MTALDEFRFFQTFRKDEQRYRYARRDDGQALAERVEHQARAMLERHGFRTAKTRPNEHFDLWCEGVRVEVKAAAWNDRYQCNLRKNDADVLLFGCQNGRVHWFVIPWEALGDRRNVAIWSKDPDLYMGQWARFREAWGVVGDLVDNPPNPYQLAFDLEV